MESGTDLSPLLRNEAEIVAESLLSIPKDAVRVSGKERFRVMEQSTSCV